MYYVYILKSSKTDRYYIGLTSNVKDRLARHNQGRNSSTKNGIPWQIVYIETCADKKEATARELKIKSYKGGRAFKQLVDR